MKDIICLLLGCKRHELESHGFKETELGEQWWYYKGEVGLYPYDTPYEANKKLPLVKLTPRLLLQLLGTQCGRQIIHPNIWVNATMVDYKLEGEIAGTYSDFKAGLTSDFGGITSVKYPNWIITDVRFPNEADAIKERKGIIIRVNTDYIRYSDGSYRAKSKMMGDFNNQHESETALDNYDFDYVINNNGTINELIEKVKSILIKEGII